MDSQPCKTSKIKHFTKIVNGWKLLTIFAKSFLLTVWQCCKDVPGIDSLVKISQLLCTIWVILRVTFMGICISRPVALFWPPALARTPGPQFVFTSPGPQFVFTGPGPQFAFNTPGLRLCLLALANCYLYLLVLVSYLLLTSSGQGFTTTTAATCTITTTTITTTTTTDTNTNRDNNNKKCHRGSKIHIKWLLKDIRRKSQVLFQ